MSISDSDSSSTVGDYKFFRRITHDRLVYEMLGSTKKGGLRSTWKVLIMDRKSLKNLARVNFQWMNDPSPFHRTSHSSAMQYNEMPIAHPMRPRRTPTWAKSQKPDDG